MKRPSPGILAVSPIIALGVSLSATIAHADTPIRSGLEQTNLVVGGVTAYDGRLASDRHQGFSVFEFEDNGHFVFASTNAFSFTPYDFFYGNTAGGLHRTGHQRIACARPDAECGVRQPPGRRDHRQ